jgi:hypothetical protein
MLVSNNERILRQQLPFILDARIYVYRLADKDTVDILVLTQDTWSISVDARLAGLKEAITTRRQKYIG